MAAKPDNTALPPGWHPSLKKAFQEAQQWWQRNMIEQDSLAPRLAALRDDLDTAGIFQTSVNTFFMIGDTYAVQACTPAAVRDPATWADSFIHAISFRALDFRRPASLSLPIAEQPLLPFWSSMKAAGPAMLSQWETAMILARLLIEVAEKDKRINQSSKDGWQKGTNDAFLVYLFSDALSIPTTYVPGNALVTEYQAVLENWRSTDVGAFSSAMSAAADFHISRSRDSTNKTIYEFDTTFDRIYPAELLVVQAFRRRDGLPEIETGHLLIDKPWSLIRDMPEVAPHPLAEEAFVRLRAERPEFR